MLSKIKKKLKMTLFPLGFCNVKNCYYYIKNDIAFCLSFDQPSGIVYCTFHIIPLYIPCEMRYYTFGNRLNSFPNSSVGILMKSASDREIDVWFENLFYTLERFIFPFFQNISDPLQLLHFVNSDYVAVSQFFHCSPDQLERLRVFTYLCLNDYDNLKRAIQEAYVGISHANYMDSVKKERHNELLEIESHLSDDNFCGSQFCAEIVNQSLQRCFGKLIYNTDEDESPHYNRSKM